VFSHSTFSDTTGYYFTNASFTGDSVDLSQSITDGTVGNLPWFTSTSLGQEQGRLVSIAARITYVGTELNRGGQIYATPGIGDGDSTLDGMSIDRLGQRSSTTICYPDSARSWCGLIPKIPQQRREWNTVSSGDAYWGFVVTGVAGEKYTFDVAGCAEYSPNRSDLSSASSNLLTPSYHAPAALTVEAAVNNTKGVVEHAGTHKASFLHKVEGFAENALHVAGVIGKYVKLGADYAKPIMEAAKPIMNAAKMIGFL
jgi:hypothetical protein